MIPASDARPPGASAPSVRHRLEFVGYRLLTGVLALLPERIQQALGSFLGILAGPVLRIRWRDTLRHLRLAFPDRPDAWRRGVARASFAHLGRESVATLRLSRTGPEAVIERTEVEGLEALEEGLAEGRGALVVTGHLGNWEIGGAALAARGVPVDAVVFRQGNPLFDRALVRARGRLGLRVVVKQDAAREVLRSLRAGRVTALVADQNIRRRGVFVDFFDLPAATARGPALFAVRSGAPLFLGTAMRLPGGSPRYRVRLERVETGAERGGPGREEGSRGPGREAVDAEGRVHRITSALMRRLENRIREAPEQYFWQHRRWKTRPAHEKRDAGAAPIPGAHAIEDDAV